MKSSPIIYLDTSFFIGLLENVAGRQADARDVRRYERDCGSKLFTSFLTLNEFCVRYYDLYRKTLTAEECDQRVNEAIASIRNIANIYGLDDDVAKESARLMSVWGELQKLKPPEKPRDRNFRWDSIHIATAHILKADRVYGFDGPWNHFPKVEIPNIGKIIVPALSPQIQIERDSGENTLFKEREDEPASVAEVPIAADDQAPKAVEEDGLKESGYEIVGGLDGTRTRNPSE